MLSVGIVGLPNVGKSTLFNALVKNGLASASNYPFCTIDPNIGIVEVPDHRLEELAKIAKPEKIIPAAVEFVDIAGIIKGASKGEGLGNKFLAHIRESAAIVLVGRFFENKDVIHVNGTIDPKNDLETVILELSLADLETIQKTMDRYQKAVRGGDKNAIEGLAYIEKLQQQLELGILARQTPPQSDPEKLALQEMQLLTAKPLLVVANIGENQIGLSSETIFREYHLENIIPNSEWLIPICASIEAELNKLSLDEQLEYLKEFNLQERGLDRLIKTSFHLLGLMTYFTAGPMEVRAWTIQKGWKAPQAAGVIHTDFEKGFIRAEVISYLDYIKENGELGAKEAGKMRLEGKDYLVQDGDVMHFRFSK